ncbi:MAG: ribosome rescue protein RqcH, partial [Thermoplasmatales archaeon]|nr:ribosome rescue protein RqcH [Thermoplasmatales archaeon]
MKDSLSSLDIAVLVNEFQTLIGGYIEKIYQTSKDELLIRINLKKKKIELLMHAGKYLCITKKSMAPPKTPTVFAITLRKYLTNARVTGVRQHGFDRIVEFDIGKYRLVAELFSRGNIILLEDSKIIAPLSYQRWAHRIIKSKAGYVYPPSVCNPLLLSFEEFKDILGKTKKDIVRTLALDMNLGGLYSEEICLNTGVDKNAKKLDEKDMKKIHDALLNLMSMERKPLVVVRDGRMVDVVPVKLSIYRDCEMKECPSFNDAVDRFFSERKEITAEEKKSSEYSEMMEKYERQRRQQENALKKFEREITESKRKADLIYENYTLVDKILQVVKKQDVEFFKEIVEENRNEGWVELLLGETRVKLDIRKNISENAGYYYTLSKKAKEKMFGVKNALDTTMEKMKNLEKKSYEKKEERKTKFFWFEKYRWFMSSNNVLVIGGRDAKSNERIVKKYLKEKDRYAHADVHGAPSIIVKGADEATLKEACVFSLIFSKAWNMKIGSGDAYWVLPEQVSKTPGAGEFIPKGAFIIRGKKNYFRGIKIRAAIGEIEIENKKKLMCGPVSAVKKHSKKYVVFEHGET